MPLKITLTVSCSRVECMVCNCIRSFLSIFYIFLSCGFIVYYGYQSLYNILDKYLLLISSMSLILFMGIFYYKIFKVLKHLYLFLYVYGFCVLFQTFFSSYTVKCPYFTFHLTIINITFLLIHLNSINTYTFFLRPKKITYTSLMHSKLFNVIAVW